jgi:hypothetical protein
MEGITTVPLGRSIHRGEGNFEIGRFLHLKSEIRNIGLDLHLGQVQFAISDFGFEMQESSNFKFSSCEAALIMHTYAWHA